MEITLNHTVVPAKDKTLSAKFYEGIFGFQFIKEWGPFAVVKVNSTLTFDFMNRKEFYSNHYAFKVSEEQFDEIFERVKAEGITYCSDPSMKNQGHINNDHGGRGFYFKDLDGHLLEVITADYVLD